MSNISKINSREIDFITLLEIIWNGKWIIAFFAIVTIFITILYNFLRPNTNFIATSEIRPIPSTEIFKYKLYNEQLSSEDLFKNISSSYLLDLFLEEIEVKSVLEEGIKKFNLIKVDKYDNEQKYNDEVIKFASQIKIIPPSKISNSGKSYYKLEGKYHDVDKWADFLQFVTNKTNKSVKNFIQNDFFNTLNLYEQKKQFNIEDINTKINIQILKYENKAKSRLAFLKEQATIARKLKVKKNTIETESFNSQNSIVTNVKTNTPFYLRGYEAIEEEIKLITNRSPKENFIPEVLELKVESEKLKVGMTTKRIKKLFVNSPITSDDFKSAIIKVPATYYEYENKSLLYTLTSFFLALMMGTIFVILNYIIKERRNN